MNKGYSDWQKTLLKEASKCTPRAIIRVVEMLDALQVEASTRKEGFFRFTTAEERIKAKAEIEKLVENGLIKSIGGTDYELTIQGFEAAKLMESFAK
jgi:hypothetical protein